VVMELHHLLQVHLLHMLAVVAEVDKALLVAEVMEEEELELHQVMALLELPIQVVVAVAEVMRALQKMVVMAVQA